MACTVTTTVSLAFDLQRGHGCSPFQRVAIFPAKSMAINQPSELRQTIAMPSEATIAHLNSAPSPAVSLPPETLTHIFSLAIGKGVSVSYSPGATPWNIAGVCKYWKGVLYSTPTLWNCITIDWSQLPNMKPADARAYVRRLGHVMGLSSHLPLFLNSDHFMKGGHGGAFLQDPDGSTWRLLDSVLQRVLHRLSGDLPTWYLTRRSVVEATHSVTWAIPNITTLLVQPRMRDLMSRSITLNLPSLECLELDGRVLGIPLAGSASPRAAFPYLHSFILQHTTLRRLVWHDSISRNFLRFADECNGFQEAPSLEELCLSGATRPSTVPLARNPPILLPYIRKLEVNQEWHQIASHLRSLRAPVLSTLDVCHSDCTRGSNQTQNVVDAIQTFLQQSECQETLTTLSLHGIDGVDMSDLLKLSPNLTQLTTSSFWSTSMSSNRSLAPLLRQITVDASSDEGVVMPHVLEDMLAIRNPGKQILSFKSFNKTWALVR